MNKPSKFALALAFAAVTASGVASAQSYPNGGQLAQPVR